MEKAFMDDLRKGTRHFIEELLREISRARLTPAGQTTDKLLYFLLVGDNDGIQKNYLEEHIRLFLNNGYAYVDNYTEGKDIYKSFQEINQNARNAGGLSGTAKVLCIPVIFQDALASKEMLRGFFEQSKTFAKDIHDLRHVWWQPIVILENSMNHANIKQKTCLCMVRNWALEMRKECHGENVYHICVLSDNVPISKPLQMQTVFFTAVSVANDSYHLNCKMNITGSSEESVLAFTAKAFTLTEPKRKNFLSRLYNASKAYLSQDIPEEFEQQFSRKLGTCAETFIWIGSYEKLPKRGDCIETSPIQSFVFNADSRSIEQFKEKYYLSKVPVDETFLKKNQNGFQEKFFQEMFSCGGTFSWLKEYLVSDKIEQDQFLKKVPQLQVTPVLQEGKQRNAQENLNRMLEERIQKLYENLISKNNGLCFQNFHETEQQVSTFFECLIISIEQLLAELRFEEWDAEEENETNWDTVFQNWNRKILEDIFGGMGTSSQTKQMNTLEKLKEMISSSARQMADHTDFFACIMENITLPSYDWDSFYQSIQNSFSFLAEFNDVQIGRDTSDLDQDQYVFYRNDAYKPLIDKIPGNLILSSIAIADRIEGIRFSSAHTIEHLEGLSGEWEVLD